MAKDVWLPAHGADGTELMNAGAVYLAHLKASKGIPPEAIGSLLGLTPADWEYLRDREPVKSAIETGVTKAKSELLESLHRTAQQDTATGVSAAKWLAEHVYGFFSRSHLGVKVGGVLIVPAAPTDVDEWERLYGEDAAIQPEPEPLREEKPQKARRRDPVTRVRPEHEPNPQFID